MHGQKIEKRDFFNGLALWKQMEDYRKTPDYKNGSDKANALWDSEFILPRVSFQSLNTPYCPQKGFDKQFSIVHN